ncbi:hypothetical protein [Spirosoma utsteinense]|uniref:hypothetical protein n=1 Tax=Spirosoma utsteinense TaxID=2585773 RepID=UPI001648CB8D|nr:hypothetical protein [Spirosoma utsteinense]MBC3785727.1 hypothetical protein [Spirosoma utsteinense]
MPQVTGFAASQIPTMLQDLEAVWEESRANENRTYQADTQILTDLWREQTAELAGPLTENDSCLPIKIVWLEGGDIAVTDGESLNHAAVTCEIDGTEPASNKVEYQITKFKSATLKIKEKDCGNHFQFDKRFQHKMLRTQIALINSLAAMVPAKFLEFSGANLTPGALGTYGKLVDGTTDDPKLTRVPAGNFNAFDLVPYVSELQEANRFKDPALFDGGNLRYVTYNAERQQNTPAGDAGQQNHFDDLRIYRDGINFRKNPGLVDSTFMVDKGAVALYTAAYGPQRQDINGNGFAETKFRTPIFGLRQANGGATLPVEADVIFRRERLPIAPGSPLCEDYFVWELKLWYIFLNNPLLSANDGVTGVIRLKRDATLTQKGTPMQKAL